MNHKHELRRQLIERRLQIPLHRRNEARKLILQKLWPRIEGFSYILSFASKAEEIDLWPLNEKLAREKKLLLPKVKGSELIPFKVVDLELDLAETGRWQIREPIPSRCSSIKVEDIDCVLVPGLGFDKKCQRLGYGIGYFDRFLSQVVCPTYGIGFKEQFLSTPIPIEAYDVSLTDVFLF